jgi:acetylornithine deacetylase/succinyl-diaminopimelate desuccinylase-like protein
MIFAHQARSLDSSVLRGKRDHSIALLKQMIAIPSSNPHVSDKNEKEIARFLKKELEGAGFQVQLQQITSAYPHAGLPENRTFTRPNVIARIGRKDGTKLILNGHIDTVSGTNMKKPFEPRVVGDRLYGRGSSDMKGGVAAIVAAAEAIHESSCNLNGELVLSLVVDEETLGEGTKEFLKRESGDFAIVAEPTENTLGIAQAGYIDFDISCRGESRHGQTALPHLWPSAFLQATNICNRIMEDKVLIRKQRQMGVEMSTTFNVSPVQPAVRSSFAWMTIEDYAVNCLLGLVPGQTVESSERLARAAMNRIKRHVTNANRQGQKTGVTKAHWNIGFVQAGNPYVRSFENAMQKVLDHNQRSYVLSFCDATHFYRANIPTILFGPGKMELGHSTDECTSIHQVRDATSVLAHAIEQILT